MWDSCVLMDPSGPSKDMRLRVHQKTWGWGSIKRHEVFGSNKKHEVSEGETQKWVHQSTWGFWVHQKTWGFKRGNKMIKFYLRNSLNPLGLCCLDTFFFLEDIILSLVALLSCIFGAQTLTLTPGQIRLWSYAFLIKIFSKDL